MNITPAGNSENLILLTLRMAKSIRLS